MVSSDPISDQQPPDICVVIVSYNTRDLTLASIRSVLKGVARNSCEIIVVDNSSADGTPDAVAAEFPSVQLIRSQVNLGFAGANNLAAYRVTAKYLLLLNPDTLVLNNAIDTLLRFAESHTDASIFGGRTLFADGSLNPASCWGRPTVWAVFCFATGLARVFRNSHYLNPEGYGGWRRDSVRQVDIVSGCFLLIRRHVWVELGGFDPTFFMYGEEADLCLRAAARGHRCMICPDAAIIHYGGASEPARADKVIRLFSAKTRLFGRHWRRGSAALGARLLGLWVLLRLIALWPIRTQGQRRRESFRNLRSIWRRRAEWYNVLSTEKP